MKMLLSFPKMERIYISVERSYKCLRDALDFRCMQGVELVLVFGLLGEDTVNPVQQVLGPALFGGGDGFDLAFDLTVYAAYPCLEGAYGFVHAFELSGMRITTGLGNKARGFPIVVLAQRDAMFSGQFDQMLTALLQGGCRSGEQWL